MDISRRRFVLTSLATPLAASAAAMAAGTLATPRRTRPWSVEKLRVAKVGVGGMGSADLTEVSSHKMVEIVALCDIDQRQLDAWRLASKDKDGKTKEPRFPNVPQFRDWREMFAKMGDKFDAVVVSVADHMHAPIAMTALNANKHVYCQKPLAHSAYENRQLAKIATSKPQLVTQMGTQRMARKWRRQGYAMLRDNLIGPVKEMHAWTDRPAGWWPQGKPRPAGSDPIPDYLSWDLFLGTAPERPYKDGYTPFNWRGTYDWGCGAFGDMACHIVDMPFYALELTYPTSVRCECTDATDDEYPTAETVTMKYPATPRTAKDGLTLVWYDGGRQPDYKALGLPEDFAGRNKDGSLGKPPSDGGVILVGEKGVMYFPIEGATPTVFADGKKVNVKVEDQATTNHWHDWVDGVLAGKPDSLLAPFKRGGLMCESLSLGAVSSLEPGKTLNYDAAKCTFTNSEKAALWCHKPYRTGWAVENL
ncbi:MAG: Gfo/Idh/MocA family oxidoreductase [Phycisphaerales bacterium]